MPANVLDEFTVRKNDLHYHKRSLYPAFSYSVSKLVNHNALRCIRSTTPYVEFNP